MFKHHLNPMIRTWIFFHFKMTSNSYVHRYLCKKMGYQSLPLASFPSTETSPNEKDTESTFFQVGLHFITNRSIDTASLPTTELTPSTNVTRLYCIQQQKPHTIVKVFCRHLQLAQLVQAAYSISYRFHARLQRVWGQGSGPNPWEIKRS